MGKSLTKKDGFALIGGGNAGFLISECGKTKPVVGREHNPKTLLPQKLLKYLPLVKRAGGGRMPSRTCYFSCGNRNLRGKEVVYVQDLKFITLKMLHKEVYMKLHVLVEQDEAGFYTVEVPALPGCLSQGATREEALANIQEAIEGWMEVMESKRAIDPKQLTEVSL